MMIDLESLRQAICTSFGIYIGIVALGIVLCVLWTWWDFRGTNK
jgi:hypothetical protein